MARGAKMRMASHTAMTMRKTGMRNSLNVHRLST